jgi:DNA-binding SARP family transcriptional activator
MGVTVGLLGALEVRTDGELINIKAARTRRLAAALLLSPNVVVPAARLIDAVWDAPPRTARQQLYNALNALRGLFRTFDGPDIVTDDLGYRISVGPECIDLFEFRAHLQRAYGAMSLNGKAETIRHLELAQKLWRGPALYGLDGLYFESVVQRLEDERLTSLELLLELRVLAGESGAVIGELTELVADHPLRESPRVSLMKALFASGRQTEALAVYDQGRRLLVDEFGLEPGPKLKDIHREILSGRLLDMPDHDASGDGMSANAAHGSLIMR